MLSSKQVLFGLLAALVIGGVAGPQLMKAQRNAPPVLAQVGPGAPLPVYMVNDAAAVLPEGFVAGTAWKFTTWTTPASLTFVATVQRTSGGWAYLTVQSSGGSGWYFVPQMPGAWEKQ